MSDKKETFEVMYSGIALGKTKEMVISIFKEYSKKHLGKNINITFCDHEVINKKEVLIKELGNTVKLISEESKRYQDYQKNRIDELERELNQQRFNNEHNLSIDQKVSDRIKELEEENKRIEGLRKLYFRREYNGRQTIKKLYAQIKEANEVVDFFLSWRSISVAMFAVLCKAREYREKFPHE